MNGVVTTDAGCDVRRLESFAEQRAAAELYRSVFGYSDEAFAVSPRLLRGLLDNGGTALGAFDDGGRIVGFCYGFTALDAGQVYHYSQATVVAAEAQGRGVGRELKYAQAGEARAVGARTMRWTFDPAIARNARFNFNSLGASGCAFLPLFYGEPETDRMLVEWPLDPALAAANRERAAELSALVAGGSDPAGHGLRVVGIPAASGELESAFADGLRALACARTDCDTAVYVFGRA
jgi:predicted GNAT superfamily acetyltransferase